MRKLTHQTTDCQSFKRRNIDFGHSLINCWALFWKCNAMDPIQGFFRFLSVCVLCVRLVECKFPCAKITNSNVNVAVVPLQKKHFHKIHLNMIWTKVFICFIPGSRLFVVLWNWPFQLMLATDTQFPQNILRRQINAKFGEEECACEWFGSNKIAFNPVLKRHREKDTIMFFSWEQEHLVIVHKRNCCQTETIELRIH